MLTQSHISNKQMYWVPLWGYLSQPALPVLRGPLVVDLLGGSFVVLGGPLVVLGGSFVVLGGPLVVLGGPFVALGGPLVALVGSLLVTGGPLVVPVCVDVVDASCIGDTSDVLEAVEVDICPVIPVLGAVACGDEGVTLVVDVSEIIIIIILILIIIIITIIALNLDSHNSKRAHSQSFADTR